MISLFAANSNTEVSTTRVAYLTRLQEISDQPVNGGLTVPVSIAEEADPHQPGTLLDGDPSQAGDGDGGTSAAGAESLPDDSEKIENNSSEEFRRFAERIAPRVIEALAGTAQEIHRLAGGDHAKLEATATSMAEISEEVRNVSGVLGSVLQQADEMGQAQQALSSRMGTLENRLREDGQTQQSIKEAVDRLSTGHGEMRQMREAEAEMVSNLDQRLKAQESTLEKFEEAQRALDSRLETQASTIRTLYASTQERRQQWEELRATLAKLQENLGVLTAPEPLPEHL